MQTKTIFTGFSPNLTKRAVAQACAALWLPWRWFSWKKGEAVEKTEEWLREYLSVEHAITFDSGRTALYAALESLGVDKGDEVLVQAYTCVVVVNAIKWTGATPVFVDIGGSDLTMNPEEVSKSITKNTKAMIIQHTFGLPAKIDPLMHIAREHNIKTIEDSAHTLGTTYKGQQTGTFADIGMFSFGSDKVVSCVRGGALVTRDGGYARSIQKYHDTLPETNFFRIWQHLMHYPLFFVGKNLYHLGIGKWTLGLAKKIGLMNKVIYKQEKSGVQVPFYPSKMPNILATLLIPQLEDLKDTIDHRKNIAKIYKKSLSPSTEKQKDSADHTYLRYTFFTNNPDGLRSHMKAHGVFLGNWYNTVLAPHDIDWPATGYEQKMCSVAERYAAQSVNLPTNLAISPTQAQRVATMVSNYLKTHT